MALATDAGLGIEAAKGALALPAMAIPLAWYPVLRRAGVAKGAAVALAVLAAASPIFIAQGTTRMVDGMMACLVAAFVGFGAHAVLARSPVASAAACGCLAIAIDVKLNALAMFGGFALAWIMIAWRHQDWRRAGTVTAALGATTVLTIVTIAFHPYVTNVRQYGQPFYPVLGAPELEINSALVPGDLRGHSALSKFARSLLAEGGSDGAPLKIPFTLSPHERAGINAPDTIVGGFGPLFSGMLLLCGLIGATLVARGHRREPGGSALLFIATMAAGSALVTPYSWWPRFIPQLWFAVLLIAFAGIVARCVPMRSLGWLCAVILAVNSLLVGWSTFGFARTGTRAVQREIAEAARLPGGYCGNFGRAHARIALMREAGVRTFPLQQSLPLRCIGEKRMVLAWDFLDMPAQSCPCAAMPHDPSGRWRVPPDTTVEDVRRLHHEAD